MNNCNQDLRGKTILLAREYCPSGMTDKERTFTCSVGMGCDAGVTELDTNERAKKMNFEWRIQGTFGDGTQGWIQSFEIEKVIIPPEPKPLL